MEMGRVYGNAGGMGGGSGGMGKSIRVRSKGVLKGEEV